MKKREKTFSPFVSIIIPAHNEQGTIIRAVKSILQSTYPSDRFEIIVIDDGSSDATYQKVDHFKKVHQIKNLYIARQINSGKAAALNHGIIKYSKGELVMCLDADSTLAPSAIKNAVRRFRDPKIKAVSSNVKIMKSKSWINLIQRMEYIISYQMKRSQTFYNIEYIIGGIGSMFRKSTLEQVGYYDTNTVTEDIDLTMKILQLGNKDNRVIYAYDVITYTECCLTLNDLIKQRYRWKWGRMQTFYKNLSLFFNTSKKHSKALTFIYLPFAIYGELAFFFEPILVGYILFITLFYRDLYTLASAFVVLSVYTSLNVLAENTISLKERFLLVTLAPLMYLLFYILSFVEYVALIKTFINLHRLPESISGKQSSTWQHVDRAENYSI